MLYKTAFAAAFLLAGAFAKVRISTGVAHSQWQRIRNSYEKQTRDETTRNVHGRRLVAPRW